MLKQIGFALLLLASFGAAGQPQDLADYNRGVDAFRSKDYEAARRHWTQAARSEDANASNNLGFLLYNGLGGEKDGIRAVALWRNAAAKGQRESQWHLAYAYEAGQGTPENAVEALAWFRCAQAAFRLQPTVDDDDDSIKRDIELSIARVSARLPGKRKEIAEALAKVYVDLYAVVGRDD